MKLNKKKVALDAFVVVAIVSAVWLLNDNTSETVNRGKVIEAVAPDAQITVSNRELSQIPPVVSVNSEGEIATLAPETKKQLPPRPFEFNAVEDYEAMSSYGQLPNHLRDVRLKQLAYDEQGNLIVNDEIKHLIESFLTGANTKDRAQAIARIEEYLGMTLPEPASSQARAILANYLEYKQALGGLDLPKNYEGGRDAVLSDMRNAFDQRKALRREHLGNDVADGIFLQEESYDDYSLARMEITSDPSLNEEQKQALLEEKEAQLPERTQRAVTYQRQQKQIEKRISELKSSGDHEDEVYQLRKAFYGEETAKRVAYFEDQSPDWQQRVDLFNQERAYIEQQPDLSSSQKQALITEIKNSAFSQKEQVKLAVQNIRNRASASRIY